MNAKSAVAATPVEQEELLEIARVVLAMLGEKDIRLKQHAERVANLCALFCENAGILRDDDLLHIYLAGLLHDTGYISIPREVLKKEPPLSEEETLLVKKHPVVGVQILSHHQRLEALLPMVRHHHEAFDGSGYPDKKQGEEIPLGARLLHLFDCFDELISVAKSPVYKGYGDVKSVQAAVPRLGFKETLSIVVAISNKSLYEVKQPQFRVTLDKMWGHSLACAYASKLIAQSLALGDPETIFLMGLVHDVGKVLLLRAFAELPQEKSFDFATVMTAIQEAHQSIGNILLKRWGFGNEFSGVVSLHEGANFSSQTNQEILVVHLANLLTRKMGLSFFEWDGKDLAEVSSAQLLGLSSEALGQVEGKVKEIIKDVAHLF